MYCKICGSKKENFRIFKINMCKECFNEISNISVMDENYDKYINLIKILLGYYITGKHQLNPVN